MGRPRKQQPTFADALDIQCETCSSDELEGIARQVSVWARVRKVGFIVRIEVTKTQAVLPLLKEQE